MSVAEEDISESTAGELNVDGRKHTINPSGADVIVFRVSHSHPHRLKRPLQHSDQLTGAQFALRVYAVMEHDVEKETPTLSFKAVPLQMLIWWICLVERVSSLGN